MAKQEVDIGVEGNDGTGDSIRESFRKVNENFQELYAVFGLGGDISFTNLDDTPDTLVNNEGKVVLVKQDGSGLDFFELVSDAGTNNPSDPANTIAFEVSGNQLKIKSINTQLSSDPRPNALQPVKFSAPAGYDSTTNSLLSNNPDSLVNEFNATHGTPYITTDELLVSKGYSDSNYIRNDGGTLTGQLSAIGGGTGAHVPQIQEVVKKSGDTMTGALRLHDHPGDFSGAGTPNGNDDLQAATKYYVDSQSTTSLINFYVSKDGDDTQTATPAGKAGRAPGYAYASIQAACQKAARVQMASEPDVGPYVMGITYNDAGTETDAYVYTSSFGYTETTDAATTTGVIAAQSSTIIDSVITDLNVTYPNFSYDEAEFRNDLQLIMDSIKFDISATTVTTRHNFLTIFAGLRYYADPMSERAISTNGYYTQTVYTTVRAKTYLLAALNTALGGTSNYYYQSVETLFDHP